MVLHPSSRRVLVVDDDPQNIILLEEILKRELCEVRSANSGEEALQILREWPAALVILDQDMPGMTGLETLKIIKQQSLDCDIMIVSAHSNPRMVSQALEQGADDYIRKPFAIIELVSRVHVRFRIRDLRQKLQIANQKLEHLSLRDDLTGLYNMRSIYEKIDHEIKRANKSQHHVACIMLDVDHFKSVNDGHDHLFGSFVIKEMGQLLSRELREVDFAARYGGDEFLIILVETDEHGVNTFCQRLCEKVRTHIFKDGNSEIRLTLSIGYAIGAPGSKYDARELVRTADHALYESKDKGRNQVNGFSPDATEAHIIDFKKKAAA